MNTKRWEKSDLSLYLKFISKKENEKVQAFALPVCKIGNNIIDLEELSNKFKNKDIFIFEKSLSLSLLEELGVTSLGRFLDGEKIEPILLNTNEILYRGSKRLDYLYDGVIFNSKVWRICGTYEDIMKFHIKFLQLYGINGGIIVKVYDQILTSIYECSKDDKNILVLLKKSLFDILLSVCEEHEKEFIQKEFCILKGLKNEIRNKNKNKIICTYTALEKHTELLEENWDRIVYIELDEVVKNNTIKKLSGNFKFGIFGNNWFSENKLREIINILNINAERNLLKYIIRDISVATIELPKAFEFKKKKIEPKELLVKLGNNKYYKINSRSNFEGFEEISESNVDINSLGKCDFTEFKSNYPTYKNMSNNQVKWYIFWREMVKNGYFIKTDYGYILLYAYEIINQFDYNDPKEGIKNLFWLWLRYRNGFDNIDRALSSWLIDFAFMNELKDELYYLLDLMILRDDVLFNVKLFMKYILNDCEFDNILDIIKISKYKFKKNDNYLFLFSEVNKVLNSINNKFKNQYDKNLFERFCPFVRKEKNMFVYFDAVYDGEDFYKIYYYSFTEHMPLIEFLNNIIKYVEDKIYGKSQKLHINKKYSDTQLNNKNKIKEIKIDINLLNSIRKETEEIQNILIIEETEEKEEKPKKEKKEEKTEINSIDKFILELNDYEKNTILTILNGQNIEENIKKIAQLNFLMPEIIIDFINEKFTQLNGDILIDTSENPLVIVDEYKEEISNILKGIEEDE